MSGRLEIRPTVLLPLREPSAFLNYYLELGQNGGVFLPGQINLASASELDIEVAFARLQITVHSRGVVRWKRLTDRNELRAGAGVEFLPTEHLARDLLLAMAKGSELALSKRACRRYPAMLEVALQSPEGIVTEITEDISREGAAILAHHPPPVGSRLPLWIKTPVSLEPIEFIGDVRWSRAGTRPAFGVQFVTVSALSQHALVALLDRIRRQLATDSFPPAVLTA